MALVFLLCGPTRTSTAISAFSFTPRLYPARAAAEILAGQYFLYHAAAISGIIDLALPELGDPAIDIAAVRLACRFFEAFCQAYP